MSYTLYATFATPEAAEKAAGALLSRGARAEDLSVVKTPTDGFTAATEPSARASNVLAPSESAPTAASGSMYGVASDVSAGDEYEPEEAGGTKGSAEANAVKGSVIGAGLGAVAVLAALVIPGVGIVLGAGALASAIAGIVATAGVGAAAGAIVGYLKDAGVDEETAREYGEAVQSGGAVLAINVPSGEVDEAAANEILKAFGAKNVNRYAARGDVA